MAAVVLLVFGLLGVLVELQSSSLVYWTGAHTTGVNAGGLIYYSADARLSLVRRGLRPDPVRRSGDHHWSEATRSVICVMVSGVWSVSTVLCPLGSDSLLRCSRMLAPSGRTRWTS